MLRLERPFWFAVLMLATSACYTAPVPRLVVVISVDQMRYDYLTRFDGQYVAGLRQLIDHGFNYTDAHQAHAFTHTAAGHATISTGVFPSRSGIVSNFWWDRERRETVYSVSDPDANVLGVPEAEGRSPANMRDDALGDWVKEQYPTAKVYSVALKDRSAILMGGVDADAAFWFDDTTGSFVTSDYYVDLMPPWVEEFNSSGLVDTYFAQGWNRILPDDAYGESREDEFPAEFDGSNTTFPHRYPGNSPGPNYYQRLRTTPHGDQLTFEFAERILLATGMGLDAVPDLLFVGASAADGVGHFFGPFSQEVQDYYLRLDEMLSEFFDLLDREVGREHYLVVLTGDHGVLPLPEELSRRGVDSRRVNVINTLVPALNPVLSEFDLNRGILEYQNGIVIEESAVSPELLPELRERLAEAVRQLPEVADAYTLEQLDGTGEADEFLELYRRSFSYGRGPDVAIRLRENYLATGRSTQTSHGSPYRYDTHVPLIFWGSGLPGGQISDRSQTVDIAPTIAQMLLIPVPDGLDGVPLPGLGRP